MLTCQGSLLPSLWDMMHTHLGVPCRLPSLRLWTAELRKCLV